MNNLRDVLEEAQYVLHFCNRCPNDLGQYRFGVDW